MPSWIWFFVIVVAVPVIATTIADIYKRHMKFREKQLEAISHETAEKAARYAAHTERLEQRVQVLERIVTDKGLDVAAEIDRLRDQRPPLN
jgi:uncharacterized protein YpmS